MTNRVNFLKKRAADLDTYLFLEVLSAVHRWVDVVLKCVYDCFECEDLTVEHLESKFRRAINKYVPMLIAIKVDYILITCCFCRNIL